MHLPNRQYRKDYKGESVITEYKYQNRQWTSKTRYYPDNVTISKRTTRAVVIGNGPSRERFDLSIFKSRSPRQNKDLVTYGCNAIYRDFIPDFLVVNNPLILDEANDIVPRNNKTIIYTDSKNLARNNRYNLIPQNPYTNAGNTATYLACFDEIPKIYMLGFDGQDSPGLNSNLYAGTLGYNPKIANEEDASWKVDFAQIARIYSNVEFIFLFPKVRQLPAEYNQLINVSVMAFNEFAITADL